MTCPVKKVGQQCHSYRKSAGKRTHAQLTRLNREIARIVKLPKFNAVLPAQSAIPVGNTSDAFSTFISREMKTWGKVAQQVKLRPE